MFRSFLEYDPTTSLSKIACPILLLFAELDYVHPPEKHMNSMLTAAEMKNTNNVAYHLFAKTTHGFMTNKSRNEGRFTPKLLTILTEWIDLILKNKIG